MLNTKYFNKCLPHFSKKNISVYLSVQYNCLNIKSALKEQRVEVYNTRNFSENVENIGERSIQKFEAIPGPPSYPVIGTLHNYLPFIGHYQFDRLHRNGFKKLQKYGPIVREQIVPGVNILWLFRPEDIQMMYQVEGKYPERRSHLALEKYRLDHPEIYNTGGLLPTNGPEWFRIRSVFQRGLSSLPAVRNFLPESEKVIHEWVDYLQTLCDKTNLDYLPEISRLFLELTCLAALDMRLHCFSKEELHISSRSSRLMKAALTTNSCILKTDNGPQLWRKFETPLYRKIRKSQEYMELVAVDLLSQKVSFFNENEDKNATVSLLESYLSSPELDLKDIIGMAVDFLLAGIDTTTYTTCFLFYHLGTNSQVQKTLFKETVDLLPNKHDHVTKTTLANAQYARAVLKESFRMNPVSVGVGRILNTDAVFSGYHVPKGTVMVSQNQVACQLERYFESPEIFRPERWLRNHPNYKSTHPFLVLPFGHGPRSCIARRLAEQNILTLLIKVVRNYEIGWVGSKLDCRSLLINKPDKPVTLLFKKRS